jgi:hypothetical protein
MSIFNVKDLTTGKTKSTNGTSAVVDGVHVKELNLQNSTDSYQVTATTTSDIAIYTGAGNDTIDLSKTSGMAFINAGAGTNNITAGTGKDIFTETATTSTTPYSQPWTEDNIAGFLSGDTFTFKGVTSLYVLDRGNSTNYTAWNGPVPGSAVYANFTNLPFSLPVNSITLHA